jgi:hypothetical protein
MPPTARFAFWVMLSCLITQRLVFPVGGGLAISFATPLVLGTAAWGVFAGWLVVDRRRCGFMLGLVAMAAVSLGSQIDAPLAFAPQGSIPSILYWLGVTSFAIVRFREPLPETHFFTLIQKCLCVIAIAGLLQYILQFVGIRAFTFRGYIPDQYLNEQMFNVVSATQYGGSIYRSNGFFLVEPSVFSQFMAIAICIEILYFRRTRWLVLFFAAMFPSVSGTGLMVLASFLAVYGAVSGERGLLGVVAIVFVGTAIFLAFGYLEPSVTDILVSRIGEFNEQGSSASTRFVTPWLVALKVWDQVPRTLLTGIGPGASERLVDVNIVYGLNTPIKLLLEYGVFGLIFYVMLIVSGHRPPRQTILLVPVLVLFFFGGTYLLFTPILFPVLLIGTVAALSEDGTATVPAASRARLGPRPHFPARIDAGASDPGERRLR